MRLHSRKVFIFFYVCNNVHTNIAFSLTVPPYNSYYSALLDFLHTLGVNVTFGILLVILLFNESFEVCFSINSLFSPERASCNAKYLHFI